MWNTTLHSTGWIFWLLPYIACFNQCCVERGAGCVSLMYSFLQVYSQVCDSSKSSSSSYVQFHKDFFLELHCDHYQFTLPLTVQETSVFSPLSPAGSVCRLLRMSLQTGSRSVSWDFRTCFSLSLTNKEHRSSSSFLT